MGLLDYALKIGKNLFSKESEASEKVQEHIEEENPGIEDLKVEVKDGVAYITGKAQSKAAMEKAVLMAGNVKGVGEVNIDGLEVPDEKGGEDTEYYTIVSGDTLSKLAKKYYGNASLYPKIFEANREVIKDPDLIFVGQKIRIPKA